MDQILSMACLGGAVYSFYRCLTAYDRDEIFNMFTRVLLFVILAEVLWLPG